MISDAIVTEAEAHGLLNLAKKGLAQGGGAGGASILDLHSGALSKEKLFINLYKTNPGLFTERDFDLYRSVKDKVKAAVAEHFNLDNSKLSFSTRYMDTRVLCIFVWTPANTDLVQAGLGVQFAEGGDNEWLPFYYCLHSLAWASLLSHIIK